MADSITESMFIFTLNMPYKFISKYTHLRKTKLCAVLTQCYTMNR